MCVCVCVCTKMCPLLAVSDCHKMDSDRGDLLLVGNYCVCSTVDRLPHKCIGMMNAYCSPHVIVYLNY